MKPENLRTPSDAVKDCCVWERFSVSDAYYDDNKQIFELYFCFSKKKLIIINFFKAKTFFFLVKLKYFIHLFIFILF